MIDKCIYKGCNKDAVVGKRCPEHYLKFKERQEASKKGLLEFQSKFGQPKSKKSVLRSDNRRKMSEIETGIKNLRDKLTYTQMNEGTRQILTELLEVMAKQLEVMKGGC